LWHDRPVQQAFGDRERLTWSKFDGGTAAAVALRDGLPAGRLVLLAPMASAASFARQFATALGFGESTYRRLITRVERRVGAPMDHFDVPALGRSAAMPRTLIIDDHDDTSTPVVDGIAIAAAWSGSQLRLTSGLGHRRLLRDPNDRAASQAFEALSYTHRREYVQWVVEAKKSETRQRRVERAVEMLEAGAKHPWA
jgi:Bacteriocin-protection, YdeI or OmpD-Associated